MIWWPTEVPTLQYGLITLRKPEERDIIPLYEGVQDPIIPKFTRIPANYQMANACLLYTSDAADDLRV